MADWRVATAEALNPLLSNFRQIDGYVIRAVWHIREDGCLVQVILVFDRLRLTIEAQAEDDTVAIRTEELVSVPRAGVDVSDSQPWCSFMGKPFGWGWATVNQQGYCDGVLLSFDGITPQLMLNVVASSIYELKLG